MVKFRGCTGVRSTTTYFSRGYSPTLSTPTTNIINIFLYNKFTLKFTLTSIFQIVLGRGHPQHYPHPNPPVGENPIKTSRLWPLTRGEWGATGPWHTFACPHDTIKHRLKNLSCRVIRIGCFIFARVLLFNLSYLIWLEKPALR